MLSVVATDPAPAPVRSRTRAVVAAIGPTARVAHLPAAAGTVALAAVPVLVQVVRGQAVGTGAVILAGLVLGATLAWGAEDRAAELLGSMPVPSPACTALRVGAAAVVVALGFALLLGTVAAGPGVPSGLQDRAPEAATAATVALAVGLVGARRGERAVSAAGVTAGILVPAVVAGLAVRWPEHLPGFAPGAVHARWWIAAAAGLVVAARAGRDPAQR